jgi:hypothetical protein
MSKLQMMFFRYPLVTHSQKMKIMNMPPNEYVYNGLLRTYAGACKVTAVPEEYVEMYIMDSWKLYDKMREENIPIND